MTLPEANHPYNDYYYQNYVAGTYQRTKLWLQFFDNIAKSIVQEINPQTVLDAGCAFGFLVELLRGRGVEAFGFDISEYAIQQVAADTKPYCRVASILDPIPQRYDLVVSIEVVEHLAKDQAAVAIKNLCDASDDILFSSTPIDYAEITHLNVQPTDYWAGLFAANGFVRDVDFDASFISAWAVRFRKHKGPMYQALRAYERKFGPLFNENRELRNTNLELRNKLGASNSAHRTLAELEASELANLTLANGVLDRDQIAWSLANRLTDIENSNIWYMARVLNRLSLFLAPPQSLRRKFLAKALRAVRSAVNTIRQKKKA